MYLFIHEVGLSYADGRDTTALIAPSRVGRRVRGLVGILLHTLHMLCL